MARDFIPESLWKKGKQIVDNEQLSFTGVDKKAEVIHAFSFDTSPATVVQVGADPLDDDCDCRTFLNYDYCEHITALILWLKENGTPLEVLFPAPTRQETLFTNPTPLTPVAEDNRGLRFLNQFNFTTPTYFHGPDTATSIEALVLEATITVRSVQANYNYYHAFFIKLRIGYHDSDRLYTVADIGDFMRKYHYQLEFASTTGKQHFQLLPEAFNESEQELLEILMRAKTVSNYELAGYAPDAKKLLQVDFRDIPQLTQLIPKLERVKLELGNQTYPTIETHTFTPDAGILSATVTKTESGYSLTLEDRLTVLINSSAILLSNNQWYTATPDEARQVSEFINQPAFQSVNELRDPITFKKRDLPPLRDFLHQFAQIGRVSAPSELLEQPMTVHFDLDRVDQTAVLALGFEYDGEVINAADVTSRDETTRNTLQEEQATAYLAALGFTATQSKWVKVFTSGEDLYQFFTRELPNMRENGVVTVSDALAEMLQTGAELSPSIDVSEVGGLLAVNFSFAGIDEGEVDSVLAQLDQNRPYITRGDGSIVMVDDEMKTVSRALARIREQGKLKQGRVSIHASQALALQAELGDTATFDAQFKQITNDLSHPETFTYEDHTDIHATLRPYQQQGVQWLEMLDSHGFGGILADEMGLGKTLQMIAFLANHLTPDRFSLVVAPASLLYNWQAEFNKFAPNIQVEVVDGNKAQRLATIESSTADVLITSYSGARADASTYEEFTLNYLVLDEAQFVKNGATKTNQSLRKLHTKNTFALSGTPVENRADELWAIFAIVMPGLLPKKRAFAKLSPAEIALRINPFLLRREKKNVLADLPDKIETNLTNEMTREQKTVYLAQLKQMQVEVKGMTSDAMVKNKVAILSGLTRLRQICDTPALYLPDYDGESGKLNQLAELMTRAMENGRRVLIFSQFTTMLDQIEAKLTEMALPSYVLNGATKPKDRLKMVDAFNAGERDIFLISLKAGGTGLNLTGADVVVLVDLWWNPAVEDQATARAHRIGQTKKVDVYRLITKGSIEEQIYKLQEQKRDFVDQVLNGTESKSSLTDADIRMILGV